MTLGNGQVAVHFSGSGRRTGDFRSPDGDVPNSFTRAGYGEAGVSYTGANGYFGGSYAYDRTHYGIPFVEEGETNVDPRRQVFTLRGEKRNMSGWFDGFRGSFGVRYRHDEKDGELVATAFENNTTELALLGNHKALGRMKGSIGGTFLTRSFSAEGEEALSAPVEQDGFSVYVYEEVAASPHMQIQFGGRVGMPASTRRRIWRAISRTSPAPSGCCCSRTTRPRSPSAWRAPPAIPHSRSCISMGLTPGTTRSRTATRIWIPSTRSASMHPSAGGARKRRAR